MQSDHYSENSMLTKVNLHKKNLTFLKYYNSNEKTILKKIDIVLFFNFLSTYPYSNSKHKK